MDLLVLAALGQRPRTAEELAADLATPLGGVRRRLSVAQSGRLARPGPLGVWEVTERGVLELREAGMVAPEVVPAPEAELPPLAFGCVYEPLFEEPEVVAPEAEAPAEAPAPDPVEPEVVEPVEAPTPEPVEQRSPAAAEALAAAGPPTTPPTTPTDDVPGLPTTPPAGSGLTLEAAARLLAAVDWRDLPRGHGARAMLAAAAAWVESMDDDRALAGRVL
jgi:outer membrane biosynthesis protein TonB